MDSTGAEDPVRALALAGRAAWPGLKLDVDAFAGMIERHLHASDDRAAAMGRMRPDDLYLACACATGDGDAIVAFERRYEKVIERAVGRFARTDEKRDELRQLLRDRLFVAPEGGAPRIASYTGQGFLENWVRVAAVRAFMNAGRGRHREATPVEEESLEALADGGDLELDFLKQHYRGAFRQAFAQAIRSLSSSDRLVLRLSVLQHLSCDELAVTLGVHRATAARRTARAKQLLVDGTRAELASMLKVSQEELASILHLVENNLELSISRLLAPTEASMQLPIGTPKGGSA